jgi:hypothetical protein
MNLLPSLWIAGTPAATPCEAADFGTVKLLAKSGAGNKPPYPRPNFLQPLIFNKNIIREEGSAGHVPGFAVQPFRLP